MPFSSDVSSSGMPPMPRPSARLVVALDMGGAAAALTLTDKLAGLPLWFKVGLELFTAEGPDVVRELTRRGYPVFLDLKFHDIPNTVRGAVRSAVGLGARMLTLHLCGGEAMAVAALEGRNEAREHPATGLAEPLVLGITELTSTAPADGMEALRRRVVSRALDAKSWGLDGVVCSGLEASLVKSACGPDFVCLCPGIRFASAGENPANDDQSRVCTPGDAVRAGADFLVMGRPVTRAADPLLAASRALASMKPEER